MTINEALTRVQRDRPGEATEAELRKWLNDLETRWQMEQIDTHWPTPAEIEAAQAAAEAAENGEAEETNPDDAALLIGSPDDEVYIYWLYSKIDMRLGEIARYNNDAAMFNTAWDAAAKRYNRTHRYKGRQLHHVVYGSLPVPRGQADDPLNQRGDWFGWR